MAIASRTSPPPEYMKTGTLRPLSCFSTVLNCLNVWPAMIFPCAEMND